MEKTSLQLLNEMCAKALTRAQYEVKTFQGAATNSHVFQAICHVHFNNRDYVSTGMGTRIKDAKQEAAKIMLNDKLRVSWDDPDALAALNPMRTDEMGRIVDGDVTRRNRQIDECPPDVLEINYIAELSQLCDRYHLPEPEYDMDIPGEGPSHCPILTVGCKVGKLNMSKSYKTKKVAKRMVAYEMLRKLRAIRHDEKTFASVHDNARSLAEDNLDTTRYITLVNKLAEQDAAKKSANDGSNLSREQKNYDDFMGANIFKRKYEFPDKLLHKKGKYWQELLDFSKEIDNTIPLEVKPIEHYEAWLKNREEGVMGFFNGLKKELPIKEVWIIGSCPQETTKREEILANDLMGNFVKPEIIVTLNLTIAKIEDDLPVMKLGLRNEEEQLKEKCVIEALMLMGIKTVLRVDIVKKMV